MENSINLSLTIPYILAGLVIALAMGFGHYSRAHWLEHNLARYLWGAGWTLTACTLIEIARGTHSIVWVWGAFGLAGGSTAACYLADYIMRVFIEHREQQQRGGDEL